MIDRMDKNAKIYVAGHHGLVGSAIWKNLQEKGYTNLVGRTHKELDLLDGAAVKLFFDEEMPEYVFLAAAFVGGIMANSIYRADFIYKNLQIQQNVIGESFRHQVKKLLFLGSTCIYPRDAEQPMKEDVLLTSPLEYTNEPYAIAKIAGPSSSGKTTFSHRLSIQLRASGFKPHAIGVDNYFVEREQTPVDENGEYNFEDLHAIDIKLFNDHMNALLRGEKVEIPQFNFLTGRKEYNGDYIQLGEENILVIEGIHCLNDELSYALPVESKFKIYISALTQLNVDEHNRVATTDGRLIRRMARDYRTRGASAKRTLSMWESVRKGEEKNIFPFQEEADAMFNSAMAYELCILKPIVEPLLFSITEDDPEYQEAKRLLKFLAYFLPCQADNVPINSIMREFIGGGCFRV